MTPDSLVPPEAAASSPSSGVPVRQRIALVLRSGLTGITVLTLLATGGALFAFWSLTRDLQPIVSEALPTLGEATEMMRVVKSIDADARRLPSLEGDFAIEAVRARLTAQSASLRILLDRLGDTRLPAVERADLTQGIAQMDATLAHLTGLILDRSRQDGQLQRRTQEILDLRARILASVHGEDKQRVDPVAWSLLEASGLLLAALSAPDPRQIVALAAAQDAIIERLDREVEQGGRQAEVMRDRFLGRLLALSDVFEKRLERQRLDQRIQGALRRLVVLDRVVSAVDRVARGLTASAIVRAQALEHRVGQLIHAMVWIAALAILAAGGLLLFVNRRVVARMVSLQRGMHSHVVGAPMPLSTQGNDEVAAMAASFLHFVDEVRAREARLEAQRQDLDQTMSALSEAYGVISGSIRYASNIQRAILPDEAVLRECFPEMFVIWEPRDVVAGDLYWCRRWGDGVLLVLGDCTGHGVPGAFMTLIANGAFNGAILETPPGDPGTLLARMHQLIQTVLSQDRPLDPGADRLSAADDGMDVGACFLNPDAGHLIFAGARFSLFVARGAEVEEISGERHGLGYRKVPHDARFSNTRLPLSPQAWYYLSTDGLIDQVGGERRRAFGKRRLKEVLATLDGLTPEARKETLTTALARHQGEETRRDDVSLIGFRGYGEEILIDESWALALDESLLTGVREIDDDHQKLFELVNRVGSVIAQGGDVARLSRLVGDLVSYTHWHFRHEERLMQASDYPDRLQHQREHEILLNQTETLQARLARGDLSVTDGLMDFLADWLRVHIMIMDKALGRYLQLQACEAKKSGTPSPGLASGTPDHPSGG